MTSHPPASHHDRAVPLGTDRSADLGRALHAFAQAWKRLRIYPPGHPARAQVLEAALDALRNEAATGELSLGVTRTGFVIGDDEFGDLSVAELAGLLYRHNVAVLRIGRSIAGEDLESLLGLLLGDEEDAAGLRPEPGQAVRLGALSLEHADYASLVATETTGPRRDASDSIWDRLLRLQLGDKRLLGDVGVDGTGGLRQALQRVLSGLPRDSLRLDQESPPEELVRLIDWLVAAICEHTLDTVEKRQLLPLSEVDDLLDSLPRSVALQALERSLTEFGQEDDQRRPFAALLRALEPRRLLRALRRLRDRSVRLGDQAVREVDALWRRTADERAAEADTGQSRAVIEQLLADLPRVGLDGLKAPAADEFVVSTGLVRAELESWPEALERLRPSISPIHQTVALLSAFAEQFVEEAWSVGAHTASAERVVQSISELVAAHHPMAAVAFLHRLNDAGPRRDNRRNCEELHRSLCAPRIARAIVQQLATDDERLVDDLRTLVSALGPSMVEQLVDQLAEEDDRSIRRRLLDFLAGFRSDMIPAARRRLLDQRWFVVRNMIGLLDEIDDRTSLPMLRQCALHSDQRVQAAALRVLTRIDRQLPVDLVEAVLTSEDGGFVERTLHLFGRTRCVSSVEPICDLLRQKNRSRATRLRAIEALGMIADVRALPTLARLLTPLALVAAEERKAVFLSLPNYPATEETIQLLRRGARARDVEVRSCCERALERNEGAPSPEAGS